VKKLLVGISATGVALGLASVAFAGSGTALLMEYGGVGGETQHKVATGGVGVLGATGGGGTLPFTGVDLALVTAGALALLCIGWILRRVGAQQKS